MCSYQLQAPFKQFMEICVFLKSAWIMNVFVAKLILAFYRHFEKFYFIPLPPSFTSYLLKAPGTMEDLFMKIGWGYEIGSSLQLPSSLPVILASL